MYVCIYIYKFIYIYIYIQLPCGQPLPPRLALQALGCKISRRWKPKSTKLDARVHQKTIKDQYKIYQKSIKNGSWRLLGGLGTFLTPRWPQERKVTPKIQVLAPSGGPCWGPESTQDRSGGLPKSSCFFDWFWGRVLAAFGPNLVPIWPPKPSNKRAKLAPKSMKRIDQDADQFFAWFLIGLGTPFLSL